MLSVALVSGALLVTTGCGQQNNQATANTNNGSSAVSSALAGHVLSKEDVDHLNSLVNTANGGLSSDNHRGIAGPRPSYQIDGKGDRQVMTIRDEDHSEWKAGLYQLSTYCMGTGTLDISFSIGEDSRNGQMECSPEIGILGITIETKGADIGTVIITPSSNSKSEIAYRIDMLTTSPNS
jgi:hypothetical protein